jgi:hypothetical protein
MSLIFIRSCPRLASMGARLLQAQLQHPLGEALAGLLQQVLDIAWRQPWFHRDIACREGLIGKALLMPANIS